MDRRSWPWKKKSSEKTITATESHNAPLASSVDTKPDQDDTKRINYVQISEESYEHLTGLEDKVKILNENISNLNETLSSVQSEMVTKDTLVKQHAKVAEEAVSGWEKAEAEALALKQQLESVTLLRLTAEDRASHLDGALKECMKQVRNVKEESDQKLHDVIFAKTKQWEQLKAELEAKIVDLEQELLRSSAENAALSRTLQERSNLLMKINDEKMQAEAEIEVMKNNIQSCEREISSLKYELHVVSKELEIRNEEKNMSMRSADVANKQHLEDIKKISKLEAECQRLRGLVRKKLPGPAALAQMKVEVESLDRDYRDNRLRRSPAKISSPLQTPDFAHENMQQCHKENEFLTARMMKMEEEMKMLKEALSKRNSELQASQNLCAKTANKLRCLEAHFLEMNQQKGLEKSMTEIPCEIESNPPSLTSMSEDGIDEEGSSSESWATALISELSQFKKEKNVDKSNKANNSNQLEHMDDFLEMERLACRSTDAKASIPISDVDTQKDGNGSGKLTVELPKTLIASNVKLPSDNSESTEVDLSLSKLRSRIGCVFESPSHDANMGKLLEDIRRILQDVDEESLQNSVGAVAGETHSTTDPRTQKEHVCTEEVVENGMILKQDADQVMVQDLKNAISDIHNFVVSIGKEAIKIQGRSSDGSGLTEKIDKFSTSVHKVLCNEVSIYDLLLALSHILSEASFLGYVMPYSNNERGSCGSDCMNKVTLLENKVTPYENARENFSGTCVLDSHSSSDPETDALVSLNFETKTTLHKFSLEEFEQLKLQKENMEAELARCKGTLEVTNHQLVEMEKHLSDVKLQLTASEKSNSLAAIQLKCMAESYKSIESHKQELETELNLQHTKVEMLENELQEEKHGHQNVLAKYKELQDNMERNSKCPVCSVPSNADADIKVKQEREIAAAAEKLAECQEAIFFLSKQLESLRPSSESSVPSPNDTLKDESSEGANGFTYGKVQSEIENAVTMTRGTGGESLLNGSRNSEMNPSDQTESCLFPTSPSNSKPPKPKPSRSPPSSSSSSSLNSLPENHGRGFSRFFSKGKSEH